MQSDEKHHIDTIFRQGLGRTSPERPTGEDWSTMRELMVKEGILKEGRKRRFIMLSLASLFSAGAVISTAYYVNKKSIETEINSGSSLTENTRIQEAQDTPPETQAANTVREENKAGTTKPLAKTGSKTSYSENGDVFLRNLTGAYDEGRIYAAKKGEPDDIKKPAATTENSVFDKLSKSPPKAPEPAPLAESTNAKKGKGKKSTGKDSGNNVNEEAPSTVKSGKEKTTPRARKKDTEENATERNNAETKNIAGGPTEKVRVDSSLIAKIDSTQKPGGNMDTEFTRIKPEKDVVDDNFSHFALGAILSYDMHRYKIMQNSIPDWYAAGDIASDKLTGDNKLGYSAGFMARFRLTYNIMFEAGVLYSQKKKVMYAANELHLVSDSLSKRYSNFSFHYNARYIDLPLQAKGFIPIGNNLNLQLSAGALFSLHAPFGDKSYYSYQFVTDAPGNANPVTKVYASNKTVNIIPYGGIGVNYLYDGKWEFFLEPGFKFSKNPVLKANTEIFMAAEHYLRTISVGFGCFYNF